MSSEPSASIRNQESIIRESPAVRRALVGRGRRLAEHVPNRTVKAARPVSGRFVARPMYSTRALLCRVNYEWVFAFAGGQAWRLEGGLTPSRQPRLRGR